jgi:uncharacterized membrane protein
MNSNLYDTVVFLHILAAIVGFGGVLFNGLYGTKAKNAATPAEGLAILEANEAATKIYEIAIYLVFVFGLILAIDGKLFDQAWLSISMGLYLVALIVSLAVIQPTARKMIAAQRRLVEGDQTAGPELGRLGPRIGMASMVNHVLFVAVLLLMVFKW